MPQVDEDSQDRQTFGNPTGWTEKTTSGEPEGASVAPPATDAEPAPSAEPDQDQTSQPAPAPTSQPDPDKKFNMPPQERWDAVIREKEEARQRAERAEQLAQLALQKLQATQPAVQQPEVDPYAGMDPQTAEFYRQMDRRIESKAAQMAEEKMKPLMQAYQTGINKLTKMEISQFRQSNPDIKPGSAEETAVAGFVEQGHSLENAKKLALYEKLEAENRALKGKQASIPRKMAASNSEQSSGIPSTSGLPAKQGDWRERVSEVIDKGGSFADAANAIFGGRRR